MNTWYAAAWSDEVRDSLLGRTILDRPIVLFRDGAGQVRAIGGRCPHRFAPLRLGRLEGDAVRCPYHGLAFDGSGACVHNPHGNGVIPRAAVVPRYPCVERDGLVWLWPGEADRADAELVPRFPFLGESGMVSVKGVIVGRGHYELYSDNIMDLGHAEFLHPGLGAPAFTRESKEVQQTGNRVWSRMTVRNDFLSPIQADLLQRVGERLDWWVDIRWDAPACMDLTLQVAEVGGSRDSVFARVPSLHVFTPETATSTHYFWAVGRDVRRDDVALSEQIRAGFAHVFEAEDEPLIAAQQASMGTTDLWSLQPVLLAGDAGAVRARRVLASLIAAEQHDNAGRAPGAAAETSR